MRRELQEPPRSPVLWFIFSLQAVLESSVLACLYTYNQQSIIEVQVYPNKRRHK